MPYEEAKQWGKGNKRSNYYKQLMANAEKIKVEAENKLKVVKPEDMPWENTPQGRIKWLVNEKMPVRVSTVDLYMQELPPGGHSGKHRHMSEEFIFVLEGKGHDLHWDAEAEIKDKYYWKLAETPSQWEWEEGDAICIPVNTAHQHFNDDPQKPARILCATNRMYRYVGYPDLEQLENAPGYKP